MQCRHREEELSPLKVLCVSDAGVVLMRKTYKCRLHNRCIAAFNPKNQLLEIWGNKLESKWYKLCEQCPDKCSSQNDNSEK